MSQPLNLHISDVIDAIPVITGSRTAFFARMKPRRRHRRRRVPFTTKSAITARSENTTTPVAALKMSANGAAEQDPMPCVSSCSITSQHSLNFHAWELGLRSHPDRKFVLEILNNIQNGVDIGYKGERTCSSRINKNWPSVNNFFPDIVKSINDDISRGRVHGPTSQPTLNNFVASPLGAFRKARSGKLRIIHDLSWPPGQSINDHISPEEFSMEFIKFDDITSGIQQCKKPVYVSKLDNIQDAFKNIPVCIEDWGLLGFTLDFKDCDGEINTSYYA